MKGSFLSLCAAVLLGACTTARVEDTLTPINLLVRTSNNSTDVVYIYNLDPVFRISQIGPLLHGQRVLVPLTMVRDHTLKLGLVDRGSNTYALPELVVGPSNWCYTLEIDQHLQFSILKPCK